MRGICSFSRSTVVRMRRVTYHFSLHLTAIIFIRYFYVAGICPTLFFLLCYYCLSLDNPPILALVILVFCDLLDSMSRLSSDISPLSSFVLTVCPAQVISSGSLLFFQLLNEAQFQFLQSFIILLSTIFTPPIVPLIVTCSLCLVLSELLSPSCTYTKPCLQSGHRCWQYLPDSVVCQTS